MSAQQLGTILGWCVIAYATGLLIIGLAILLHARWLRATTRAWRRLVRAWIIWRYLGRPWRIAIDRAWRAEP
jgi:hypothetical protein